MADDVTTGAEAPSAPIPAPALPADTGRVNAREAGNIISEWRAKQQAPAEKTEQTRVNGRFAAAPQESTAQAEDAAPPKEATGETQDADPAELPPLERPRSWAKEKAEHWSTLDRTTQELLLDFDKTTSEATRRSQNEAADQRKAAEAEKQAAEQARQQHEALAQNSLQILQQQQASEFADIKTHADVQKLATDDPFRFAQWQAKQMVIQSQMQEVRELQSRREQEKAQTFKAWAEDQDTKFTKQFPEFGDSEKGPKLRESVKTYLTKEIGVPADALAKLWETDLFRDAMWQRVVYEASRFSAAQQQAKSALQVPKPPVLKPGVAAQKGAAVQQEIADAQSRLKESRGISSLSAARDLIAAKRKAGALGPS